LAFPCTKGISKLGTLLDQLEGLPLRLLGFRVIEGEFHGVQKIIDGLVGI
jgi:hypothetical protein